MLFQRTQHIQMTILSCSFHRVFILNWHSELLLSGLNKTICETNDYQSMKMNITRASRCGVLALALLAFAEAANADTPYKILKTTQTMGTGGIDYVYADNENRRLYVPRGGEVLVFDLDTLKSAGAITNSRARGVAVDPKSQHGFCSSSPGVMWDAKTDLLFVMCHEPQSCVVLSAKDGKILSTLPIGRGTDGGGFNPNTMEAFSSQGDGTLTIIKENSTSSFEVKETVRTKSRAKT